MSWTWEERLPHLGGHIVVTPTGYDTRVYFAGKDRRSSGTFWRMTHRELPTYIAALNEAWARFEQLAAVAPAGADLSAPGKMGIGIHLSGWPGRGITLHGIHSLISSRSRLDDVIAELRQLGATAERVQAALKGVSTQAAT